MPCNPLKFFVKNTDEIKNSPRGLINMMKTNRWGRWNCSYCLTERISTKHTRCPTCDDPRNPELSPSEKPYYDPNGEIIVDEAEKEWAEAGPAWNCGKCGELNQGDAKICHNCDEELGWNDTVRATAEYRSGIDTVGIDFDDEADSTFGYDDDLEVAERVLTNEPERGEHRTLPYSKIQDKIIEPQEEMLIPSRPEPWLTAERKNKAVKIGGGSSIGVGILTLILFLFGTTSIEMQVADLQWERQVEIEEFRTLTQEGWDFPSDARNIDSWEEVRSYRKVPDGFETETYTERVQTGTTNRTETKTCTRTVDNGNGSFSSETYSCGTRTISEPVYENVTRTRQVQVFRDEPVYDTRYEYQVDRWVTDRWVVTNDDMSDGILDEPIWADPDINSGTSLGSERIGNGHRSDYVVIFQQTDGSVADQQIFEESFEQSEWETYGMGENFTAKVNRLGMLSEITPVI